MSQVSHRQAPREPRAVARLHGVRGSHEIRRRTAGEAAAASKVLRLHAISLRSAESGGGERSYTGSVSSHDEDEAARTGVAVLQRSRSLTRVVGPDAFDLLQSLLSCDVALASDTRVVYGLVLTPKARIVADVRVLRVDAESFLLDAAVPAGPLVERMLLRYRLARRVAIETDGTLGLASVMGPRLWTALPGAAALEGLEEDTAVRVAEAWLIATAVFGVPAVDVLAPLAEVRRLCEATGADSISPPVADALRIEAGVPRYGTELDDRVMPAEAGVVDRAVSFTKGCYPGQEPVTRLAHRGHANRGTPPIQRPGWHRRGDRP